MLHQIMAENSTLSKCPVYGVYYSKRLADSEALSEGDIMRIMAQGLEGFMAVSLEGKLATSWGNLKAGY